MSQTLTGSQSAIMTVYRDQFIAGAERGLSVLKDCVTTDYINKGGSYVFLVADSGAATAVTRGLNGKIPGYVVNNNQLTVTLTEQHAPYETTDFNVFQSQGPQLEIMRMSCTNVLGRKIDSEIFTAMDTCTQGVSTTATTDVLGLMTSGQTLLGRNDFATDDGNVTAVISTTFFNALKATKEFGNVNWSNTKAHEEGIPNQRRIYDWNGTKILVHNGVPGVGTASEKNFIFHKNAVGFAMDKLDVELGYLPRDRMSFSIASANMGAKLLQNGGCIELLYDASGVAAASV